MPTIIDIAATDGQFDKAFKLQKASGTKGLVVPNAGPGLMEGNTLEPGAGFFARMRHRFSEQLKEAVQAVGDRAEKVEAHYGADQVLQIEFPTAAFPLARVELHGKLQSLGTDLVAVDVDGERHAAWCADWHVAHEP